MGVRETVTTSLLGGLVPFARRACRSVISLVGFLCVRTVFWGLVGGVFYLLFKGKAGPVPKDVEAIDGSARKRPRCPR